MISLKYWYEPSDSDNIVGVVVQFFGRKEVEAAFLKAYDEAKRVFGEWHPLDIMATTHNHRGCIDNDIIIVTRGNRRDDKRKRKRFYLPSELESSYSRRESLRK